MKNMREEPPQWKDMREEELKQVTMETLVICKVKGRETCKQALMLEMKILITL